MKLVAAEVHSSAMYHWQEEAGDRLVTSDLGEAEVLRAVRRVDTALLDRAQAVLSTVDIVPVDRSHLSRAALIAPAHLRTLDTIHVVVALDLGDRLRGFVTYDDRQADAARDHGMHVERPV